ncbi:MAG: DUF429 domain-containing protein [Gammaproteobacteria bacterium]
MSTGTTTTRRVYLGVDLSSRYARVPRPNDACELVSNGDGTLHALFWQWRWPAGDLASNLGPLLERIHGARLVMIDGPQGLARPGAAVRESERLCATPGRTGDRLPDLTRPYSGFLRSSIELYAALHGRGVPLSVVGAAGGVHEFYPGGAWPRLAGRRLSRKTSEAGRRQRTALLRRFGVHLDPTGEPLSHDRLDACLGAVLAAAADGAIAGLQVAPVGCALWRDDGGILREGPIVMPAVVPGDDG